MSHRLWHLTKEITAHTLMWRAKNSVFSVYMAALKSLWISSPCTEFYTGLFSVTYNAVCVRTKGQNHSKNNTRGHVVSATESSSVLPCLAVCIVPFEHSTHLEWRFYNEPLAFQLSPHSIKNIYSVLLTQGWSLTAALLTVNNEILHLERRGVCVCLYVFELQITLKWETRFEGFRVSRDRFMVKLKLGKG